MEQTYEDTKKMTENEFDRLESSIKSMAIGKGQWTCPRLVEDTATCLLVYGKEPLKCEHLVRQFELCMDTLTAESTKRKHMDDIRRARKKICLSSA